MVFEYLNLSWYNYQLKVNLLTNLFHYSTTFRAISFSFIELVFYNFNLNIIRKLVLKQVRLFLACMCCNLGFLLFSNNIFNSKHGFSFIKQIYELSVVFRRNLLTRTAKLFLFCKSESFFVACEMLQWFTPHRVCHPNPLRHYGNRLSEKSESFFVFEKPASS